MSLTLQAWRSATTLLVITKLPLQDNQSSSILVSTYLSDIGGWVPIDEDDSTGAGEPANGETPDIASSNIAVNQYQRMYDITSNETIVVKLKHNANFTEGETDDSVMTASRDEIEALVVEQLKDTMLELVSIENQSFEVVNRGLTIAQDRVDIQTAIIIGNKLIDPKTIGLEYARSHYLLDDTYNVFSLYQEEETEMVIEVRKYQDTNYAVLDSTASTRYVLSLDAENYTLSTGIVLPN